MLTTGHDTRMWQISGHMKFAVWGFWRRPDRPCCCIIHPVTTSFSLLFSFSMHFITGLVLSRPGASRFPTFQKRSPPLAGQRDAHRVRGPNAGSSIFSRTQTAPPEFCTKPSKFPRSHSISTGTANIASRLAFLIVSQYDCLLFICRLQSE